MPVEILRDFITKEKVAATMTEFDQMRFGVDKIQDWTSLPPNILLALAFPLMETLVTKADEEQRDFTEEEMAFFNAVDHLRKQ